MNLEGRVLAGNAVPMYLSPVPSPLVEVPQQHLDDPKQM